MQREMEKRAQAARYKPGRRAKKDEFAIFRELDNDTPLALAESGPIPAAVVLNKGLPTKKRPARRLPGDPGVCTHPILWLLTTFIRGQ